MSPFAYFILGVIAYQILKLLALAINDVVIEYRRKRVLRQVRIKFPDNSSITFHSVGTSDKKTMADILRQLEVDTFDRDTKERA